MTEEAPEMPESALLLKNGVWVHQTEYEALRRLLRTCQRAIDSNPPSHADWRAVREGVYAVLNAWMDVEDEDRVIRDLIKTRIEMEQRLEDPPSHETPDPS